MANEPDPTEARLPPLPLDPSTPAPPHKGRRLLPLGGIVAAVVFVLLRVIGSLSNHDENTEPLTSAQHAEQLAKGESAALASELVEVPGYFYRDVSDEEVEKSLDRFPMSESGPLRAVSLHEVRPLPYGEEIAFLQLFALDPTDAIHSQAYEERFARGLLLTDDIHRMEFSGQVVFLAEDPSSPASRYKYVWLRHGTAGWADGPDRAAVERWLKAYFAVTVVIPGENLALVERLMSVPGFTYTNETKPGIVQAFTGDDFAGADYSIHHVFDETHESGVIVLIGPAPSLSEEEFVADVASSISELNGAPLKEVGGREIGGVAVHRLFPSGGGPSAFVWWWADAGIGGALVTDRPDIGKPFLRSFLAAQP